MNRQKSEKFLLKIKLKGNQKALDVLLKILSTKEVVNLLKVVDKVQRFKRTSWSL